MKRISYFYSFLFQLCQLCNTHSFLLVYMDCLAAHTSDITDFASTLLDTLWGVRGRVVKVVDFKPLAPHRCGFEFQQGLWIISFSCEEAIHLAYETSVVLLRCPFVPEIMHGRAPQRSSSTNKSWNVVIWPILCQCDVKPNHNKQTRHIH
jgi:hypothetical protein